MSKVNTAFFLPFLGAPSHDPPSPLKTTPPWIPCTCSVSPGPLVLPWTVCTIHVSHVISFAFQHPVTQPYVPNMFCSLCPSAPAFYILQAG